jgi:saccharopine dehydrogenase-like NADP-dependent oxidoreductase
VSTHTLLVLGGYGFFGSRICEALATHPTIRLLPAGRDIHRASATARALGLPPEHAIAIDANSHALAARLRELGVNTLIHTAGPFQQQDYAVAKAAIDASCHYIDLADGRQFVAGIGSLDALARERGVTVISGASSVPALSCAVVDRYLPQFERLDSIRLGIGSGARAPGLAAVQGIFGYCGKPFQCWEDGAWTTQYGWLDLRRHRFPHPVGSRLLGRCDIPDLELFPRRYPSVRNVSFHAGFANDLGHLLVWALAGLVRAGVLPSAAPFAIGLNRLSRRIERFVSDKGGMFVALEGIGRDHKRLRITWNVLAARNHGPHIPCGAAIALAQKLATGAHLPTGAVPCMGLLTVEEYLQPLRGLDIREVVE